MASGFVVKQKGKFFFGKYFRIRREVQFMCLEVLSKTFWKIKNSRRYHSPTPLYHFMPINNVRNFYKKNVTCNVVSERERRRYFPLNQAG